MGSPAEGKPYASGLPELQRDALGGSNGGASTSRHTPKTKSPGGGRAISNK
jgi:hypothetical protein